MTQNQKLILLKLLAVGAAGYYLYHARKAQGGTLSGHINTDKIANLGAQLFPAEYRGHAQEIGTVVLNRMFNNG
jgi:hypothetical protein